MSKRKDTKKQKVEYYCPECDGTNVRLMCDWDNETQQWVESCDTASESTRYRLSGDWCDDCDEPIRQGVREREIK